jgi:hypothetical protein
VSADNRVRDTQAASGDRMAEFDNGNSVLESKATPLPSAFVQTCSCIENSIFRLPVPARGGHDHDPPLRRPLDPVAGIAGVEIEELVVGESEKGKVDGCGILDQ